MSKYKVYVSTCNQHIHLIKLFQYIFNNLWSSDQEVVVLGYDSPDFKLNRNFDFVSMGKQTGGTKMWANDLRKYFTSIPDTHFIYMLEDMFLQKKINLSMMDYLIEYCIKDSKLGRVGFTPGISKRKHTLHKKEKDFDIITLDQDAEYRIAVQTSLWNKEFFLKYMGKDYSPWDYEIKGSVASKNDGYNIYATKGKFCVNQIQAVVKGNMDGMRLTGIRNDIVNGLKRLSKTTRSPN